MRMCVNVLKVTRFDGEIDGRHFRTGKVTYLDDTKINAENAKGHEVVVAKSNYSVFDQITEIPAIYDLDVQINYYQGKPQFLVLSATKVKE